MTTAIAVKTPPAPPPAPEPFRFPEPPEREIDESMTNHRQLTYTGHCHHLVQYLGNRDTTLVGADFWLARGPRPGTLGLRCPDLLIAFDVDPAAYFATGGYLITEQGKPPDFVLEVASESTAKVDVEQKPADYAALGILEYWRFDQTGEYCGSRLTGDRLVDDHYEPIPIEELPDGVLQGYSPALHLYLRWERGRLTWHDPATGRHILTFDDVKEAHLNEQARTAAARAARLRADARTAEYLAARFWDEALIAENRAARLRAEAGIVKAEARISERRLEIPWPQKD